MNTKEAILSRRSTRRYLKKALPQELVEEVIEAGRYAPSGGNSQLTHFVVISDPEVLARLEKTVQEQFARMEITEGMYRSKVSSITRSKAGNYHFTYGAPVLIVTANRRDYDNHMADCVAAVENMLVRANDLDLGSCYINQLHWLNENEEIRRIFASFGLQEEERIYASLVVGYPDTEDGLPERKPLPRTGNKVTYIR
ncbi:MAG: nitroreductase family protein [Erysipelotrichaceae bacterium]|nr:nitroreductase family protein [Erysipelotrichaceae bacterium]